MKNKLVLMEDIIGHLASEHGIPLISFDDLVGLGRKASKVYHLEDKAKRITFDMMCYYIKQYISTPWGLKELRKLAQ